MKVCYITTVHGTVRSFLLKFMEYLHEKTDWEISVICNYNAEFEKSLPDYIHYFPVPMERGISLGGFQAMLQIQKIFKREKFDLIQYATPNASCYASIAGWLAGVPVRLYCQWGIAYVGMHGLKRKIFKLEEKLVCRLSTWIEPDSKSNLQFAHGEGLYPMRKGSVIGEGSACGVNFEKFDVFQKESNRASVRRQYGIPTEAYVYGFVGRITRDKGINELFSAFQQISEAHPDAYLMLVGSVEREELLDRELYQWSKACERVVYTGRTNAVEKYLAAMDCYVLPSYREGFGMGTIEAEAMQVPVIVTDIPGPIDAMLPEVTGKVVPKADAEALCQAMLEMRRAGGPAMGEKGRAFVLEHFEQGKLFAQILQDRKELLKLKTN